MIWVRVRLGLKLGLTGGCCDKSSPPALPVHPHSSDTPRWPPDSDCRTAEAPHPPPPPLVPPLSLSFPWAKRPRRRSLFCRWWWWQRQRQQWRLQPDANGVIGGLEGERVG